MERIFIDFDKYLAEKLKNPEFRKEFEKNQNVLRIGIARARLIIVLKNMIHKRIIFLPPGLTVTTECMVMDLPRDRPIYGRVHRD